MILCQVTIGSTTYYVSDQALALEHAYYPYVFDVTNIIMGLTHVYGGRMQLSFGGITFSPKLFDRAGDWPPPQTVSIVIKYTDTNEAGATTLISCDLIISSWDNEGVTYDFKDTAYEQTALTDISITIDGNSVQAVRPLGIGISPLYPALKILDSGNTQWELGGFDLDGADGASAVSFYDAASPAITASVTTDERIEPNAAPVVGVYVLMINTTYAKYNTLDDLASAARTAMGITNYNNTYARSTSPSLFGYFSNQINIIDLLIEVCSFFCHYIYIENDTLYLVDMLNSISTVTLNEYEFYSVQYEQRETIKDIIAERIYWSNYGSLTSTYQATMYGNTVSFGTTTSAHASKIVDSGANFIRDGVRVGMVAKIRNDSLYSAVATITVVAATELTLSTGGWADATTYAICNADLLDGPTMEITAYAESQNDIPALTQQISQIYNRDYLTLRMPMSVFSSKGITQNKTISFTDTSTIRDVTCLLNVREIVYNLAEDEVILAGDGYAY